jgi:hypothetical protein
MRNITVAASDDAYWQAHPEPQRTRPPSPLWCGIFSSVKTGEAKGKITHPSPHFLPKPIKSNMLHAKLPI